MEFKEKNKIVRELASQDFIPKDRSLLESNFPGHELLSCCSIASRQATLDNEILYVLLDKLTPEEIINHRYGIPKKEHSSSGTHVPPSDNSDSSKKKSQKKRNTPKSTGQTSRTKTSKKQS